MVVAKESNLGRNKSGEEQNLLSARGGMAPPARMFIANG